MQTIQGSASAVATLMLVFAAALAAPAAAQTEPQTLPWKPGTPSTPIGSDLAEIDLSSEQVSLDQAGTRALLEMTQIPTDGAEVAVVAPAANDRQWFLVFEWNEIGYVEDDEKDELDATALLQAIRAATAAGNEERARRGLSALEIVGWHEEPHYDASTHHLTWATAGATNGIRTITRKTQLLGRKGVMTVTLLAASDQMATASAKADELLGAFRFRPGNAYAEYQPGKDRVAEIGLEGLILGSAGAAKPGLLGKYWKGIAALAVVALGAGIARLFGRRRRSGVA